MRVLICHRQASLPLLLSVLLLAYALPAKAAEPKKVAFLVGVSKYDKAGLNNLAYAEDDISALGKALDSAGFRVETLLGSSTVLDLAFFHVEWC